MEQVLPSITPWNSSDYTRSDEKVHFFDYFMHVSLSLFSLFFLAFSMITKCAFYFIYLHDYIDYFHARITSSFYVPLCGIGFRWRPKYANLTPQKNAKKVKHTINKSINIVYVIIKFRLMYFLARLAYPSPSFRCHKFYFSDHNQSHTQESTMKGRNLSAPPIINSVLLPTEGSGMEYSSPKDLSYLSMCECILSHNNSNFKIKLKKKQHKNQLGCQSSRTPRPLQKNLQGIPWKMYRLIAMLLTMHHSHLLYSQAIVQN